MWIRTEITLLLATSPAPTAHLGLEVLLQQSLQVHVLLLQRIGFHQQRGPLCQHKALSRKTDKKSSEFSVLCRVRARPL
jgi:hypothetical protein